MCPSILVLFSCSALAKASSSCFRYLPAVPLPGFLQKGKVFVLISCLTFTGLQIGTEIRPQKIKVLGLEAFSVSKVLTASKRVGSDNVIFQWCVGSAVLIVPIAVFFSCFVWEMMTYNNFYFHHEGGVKWPSH